MAREFSKTIYDIGQRIRQVRLEKDMSQTDLALAMDTSRNVISRWETGENAIRLDSLLRLSEELQVSPVSLIRTNVDDASEACRKNAVHNTVYVRSLTKAAFPLRRG